MNPGTAFNQPADSKSVCDTMPGCIGGLHAARYFYIVYSISRLSHEKYSARSRLRLMNVLNTNTKRQCALIGGTCLITLYKHFHVTKQFTGIFKAHSRKI